MKRIATFSAIAVAALLLAGCTSAAPSGNNVTQPASDDPVAVAAGEAVAEYLERPTSIGITEPIAGEIPEDKDVYWLQCASPSCVRLGDYLKEATDAVGWKLTIVDAGFTAESVKAAWAQAVAGKPDAVIGSGFSRAFYEDELQALAARDIPVLNMTTAEAPEDGYAAAQNWGPDFTNAGIRLANYALSISGEDVKAVNMPVSAFANLSLIADGFKETIEEACDTCTVDTLDIPVTSIGGDLPTRVVTYLQSHPDVNWVNIGYADMMVGVPAALRAAGIPDTVKFVTTDTLPTTSVYLEQGDYLFAVEGSPKPEMMWRHIDFLIRHFNGEDTAPATDHTLPVWIINGKNVPDTTDDFPLVEDYKDQYKALWGLGK